ncbi:30S ribosomal protein S3 [Candidatus Nomurabacteria bacterium]|nr:30S ribosomal protein S3 [Candidatus Nomurabacteria bacterium]USN94777.1 MAG: 30S ribosomal protein S3 [Candidatus Nomurabacteria bacterium]
MTKIVHPYAHRLGILRDWKSRWFSDPKKYFNNLKEDIVIRDVISKKMKGHFISLVEIERSQKATRVIINTSRPGMVIGRQGEGSQKLRAEIIKNLSKKGIKVNNEFKLDIVETKNPDSDAAIIAASIVEGLEKRIPFRRVAKQAVEKVSSQRNVKGVRIVLSGRLGGAEMARKEEFKKGSIPLQTFRADVDFIRERASLPYGDIGIKVWVYKGLVFADADKNVN